MVARLALAPSTKLLHVTPLDLMFGRDIHTMLRGLRLDRYAFPLSAIRSSQGLRFPLRVTRSTESASHSVGARGAGACVLRPGLGGERVVHGLRPLQHGNRELQDAAPPRRNCGNIAKLAASGAFSGSAASSPCSVCAHHSCLRLFELCSHCHRRICERTISFSSPCFP